MSTDEPVVVVFPTIMDGTVVRWYATARDAVDGRDMVSASRHRASVHLPVPDDVKAAAEHAYQTLRRLSAIRRLRRPTVAEPLTEHDGGGHEH